MFRGIFPIALLLAFAGVVTARAHAASCDSGTPAQLAPFLVSDDEIVARCKAVPPARTSTKLTEPYGIARDGVGQLLPACLEARRRMRSHANKILEARRSYCEQIRAAKSRECAAGANQASCLRDSADLLAKAKEQKRKLASLDAEGIALGNELNDKVLEAKDRVDADHEYLERVKRWLAQ